MNIGSQNFKKLPAIDQARIFLLQKSPQRESASQIDYLNNGLMKTYLKHTMHRLNMDDPISLNKTVEMEKDI